MSFARLLRPAYLAGLTGIVFAALLGYKLMREHEVALSLARVQTQTFANVLEEHARQTFRRVASHLQQANQQLGDLHDTIDGDSALLQRQLTELLPADRLIRSFMVLDRKGNVLLTTQALDAGADRQRAKRDYFAPHINGADRDLVFGTPEQDRLDGNWMLPVSRRITRSDGTWTGVLVAMVQPGYFQSFYDSIDRSGHRFVSLYLTSGYAAVSSPLDPAIMGRNWMTAPLFLEHMPGWPTGTIEEPATGSAVDNIYSYRVLNDYPVVISYGVETASVLEAWHATAWRYGLLLLLGWAALAAAGVVTTRYDNRRRAAERTLADSQERYRALIEYSPVGIAVHKDDSFAYVNPAVVKMLGYDSAEDLLKVRVTDVIHPDFRPKVAERVRQRLSGEPLPESKLELKFLHRDGHAIDAETDGSVIPYEGGNAIQVCIVDTTMRKAAAEEIEQLAYYDPLTRLPNRRLLLDRLRQAVVASARHGRHGAVLFLDLDHFKTLNDTQGHDAGDALLLQVAQRLKSVVRECDTVARLGGDEFVVLLEDLSAQALEAAEQTQTIGEKILHALNQAYQLGSHAHHSTASIGAVLFKNQQISVEDLLKQTDMAMYAAKTSGRNMVRFFDPQMQASITERAELDADLRHALTEQQFRLYFQKQVSHDGKVIGAEVLLRWLHPRRGLVAPGQFIPHAEETGQIVSIGLWVLQQACHQLKRWEADPERSHLRLAVNVSARQFRQTDFVEQVREVLQQSGARPSHLKLELTESTVLHNVDDTIAKMNALKAVGVRFSMDDFGTGHSSLSYLTQLPLNQLKIDQSFVRNIGVRTVDALITQTIIGMANNLGIEVIAEGVETESQRRFLEEHGCLLCQGYLFGKPAPLDEFERSFHSPV
jgi:diguanylate cyclase (GGDEF)-like protein/PAS domain S-box-containing protein